MLALLIASILSVEVVVLGPGVLAPADPGVLEDVARRRAAYGWRLEEDHTEYDVLAAPADCGLVGRTGWLWVWGKRYTVVVVDCEAGHHRGQMAERGILADVNVEELGHRKGWLVLR